MALRAFEISLKPVEVLELVRLDRKGLIDAGDLCSKAAIKTLCALGLADQPFDHKYGATAKGSSWVAITEARHA